MLETQTRPAKLFLRASLLDMAHFVIGLPGRLDDREDVAWRAVREFVKDNDRLGLPDPFDVFPTSRTIGFVAFSEARQMFRSAQTWPSYPRDGGHPFLLETILPANTAVIPEPQKPDLRDNRPLQTFLDL